MSRTLALAILALSLCGCGSLPVAYTPITDPRCATFEESAKRQNVEHCHDLTAKLQAARYPGWPL